MPVSCVCACTCICVRVVSPRVCTTLCLSAYACTCSLPFHLNRVSFPYDYYDCTTIIIDLSWNPFCGRKANGPNHENVPLFSISILVCSTRFLPFIRSFFPLPPSRPTSYSRTFFPFPSLPFLPSFLSAKTKENGTAGSNSTPKPS